MHRCKKAVPWDCFYIEQFLGSDFLIYFDNAATSGKKPQSVINAVNYSLKYLSANPGRSGHKASQTAALQIYNTRQKLSDFFESDGPETVVFTCNCTTSINMVLKGVLNKGDHVIVSDLEHNAVMRPLCSMGVEYTTVEVSLDDDYITVENFKKAIKNNTKMIFCTAASNVLGKVLPIKEIGELCKQKGILFGVDAAQAAGVIPISMNKMNIDYLCIAPHKGLYSPMGIGVLIARGPIYNTLIEGGTGTNSIDFYQPDNLPERLESGTLNLPAIVSLKFGIDFLKNKMNCIYDHENTLVKRFYDNLQNDKVVFYTNPHKKGYVPVISFNLKDYNSEQTAEVLNKSGFALRAGLHCAPLAHKKIGTLNCGTVRFSPSYFNYNDEVQMLVNKIKKI